VNEGNRVTMNFMIYDLRLSPNIIRVIKSRRMKWVGHVARMGSWEVHVRVQWVCLSERDHWEVVGVGGRIILKWNCQAKIGGVDWSGSG